MGCMCVCVCVQRVHAHVHVHVLVRVSVSVSLCGKSRSFKWPPSCRQEGKTAHHLKSERKRYKFNLSLPLRARRLEAKWHELLGMYRFFLFFVCLFSFLTHDRQSQKHLTNRKKS